MHITPGGEGSLTIDEIASIGDIYVDRGINQDTIITTSTGSIGIGFSWYAVISGTHAVYTAPPSPNRMACAYCQNDDLIITQTIKDDPFGITIIGPSPDYKPPNIKTINTTTLFIPKGKYYALGPRLDGQYIDLINRDNYWNLNSYLTIDIPTTITGSNSSTTSGWYSIYIKGSTINDIEILPMIRIYGGDYNETYIGKTTISGGKHDEPNIPESIFIVDYDTFNNYRLIKVDTDETVGTIMTIEGTVDSPDRLVVDGNHFGEGANLEQGDFLLLAPPESVPNLYLGSLRINENLEVVEFERDGWNYNFDTRILYGSLDSSFANTDLITIVSPLAKSFSAGIYVIGNSSTTLQVQYAKGLSGSTGNNLIYIYENNSANHSILVYCNDIALSAISIIRNLFRKYTSSWVAADDGQFQIQGFKE